MTQSDSICPECGKEKLDMWQCLITRDEATGRVISSETVCEECFKGAIQRRATACIQGGS